MKKYIIPTKGRIQEWKSFFEGVFKEEEHQGPLLQTLVTMAMWIAFADKYLTNENPFVKLLESTMDFASQLADEGSVDFDDEIELGQLAYEFVVSLAEYLKGVGILQVPKVLKFEGFVNMDILINILDDADVEEVEKKDAERSCLSG